EGVKKKPLSEAPTPAPEGPLTLDASTLPQLWSQVLANVGGMLGGELNKVAIPAIIGPNTLVLRFAARYNASRQTWQAPDRTARVEDALRKLTGTAWQVKIETEPDSPSIPPGNGVPEGVGEVSPVARAARRGTVREEAEKLPLVKYAVEKLGATIQRV